MVNEEAGGLPRLNFVLRPCDGWHWLAQFGARERVVAGIGRLGAVGSFCAFCGGFVLRFLWWVRFALFLDGFVLRFFWMGSFCAFSGSTAGLCRFRQVVDVSERLAAVRRLMGD